MDSENNKEVFAEVRDKINLIKHERALEESENKQGVKRQITELRKTTRELKKKVKEYDQMFLKTNKNPNPQDLVTMQVQITLISGN